MVTVPGVSVTVTVTSIVTSIAESGFPAASLPSLTDTVTR